MMLAQASGGGGSGFLILMIGLAGVMFFMMRSQRKRTQAQQNVQRGAEVGDDVMTTAGIFGTIVDEDEDEGTVMLEIAPGTTIKMLRAGISRRLTDDGYDEDEVEVEVEDEDEDKDNEDTDEPQAGTDASEEHRAP
jgi:preprotein translocase subunit YajC